MVLLALMGLLSYTCNCVEGFEGQNCEQDIDDCADDPCLNNATCTDLVDMTTLVPVPLALLGKTVI